MKQKVLETIKRYSMVSEGDTVTVGLSGGADSVALLLVLNELKKQLGITVRAAHLNHLLRGEESFRDEEFSKKLCERVGVEFILKRMNVKELAVTSKQSIELAAREARYAFFEEIGGIIATAHTASDNAETVLFNIARGTALKGLSGIPAKRDNIIRPLLFVSREETEQYCVDHGVEFVVDSTNNSNDFARNKIRHNAVPTLKEINPSFLSAVSRMTKSVKEDSDYLDSKAREALSVFKNGEADLKELKKLSAPILTRVLCLKAEKFYCDTDNRDIELMCSILNRGEGALELKKDIYFEVKNCKVRFYRNSNETYFYEVNSTVAEKNSLNVNNEFIKNAADCDKIVGDLTFRTRKSGDKIKLSGRGVTKTLKQLFCERKIPLYERSVLPVVCDSEGLVWVYSFGVAERCAVDRNTKKICIFSAEKRN